MQFDLEAPEGDVFGKKFDVCISGTGPAGMPLAIKLAEKGHRVLLLEAGGLIFSEASNKVYMGSNTGLDYFPSNVSRQRYFGGTSNHWGGQCHVLGAGDFEERGHVPHSGWPIKKEDLDPYFAETSSILDIKEINAPDYLQLQGKNKNLKKTNFTASSPGANIANIYRATNLANKYRCAIEYSENITCVLNANVVDIKLGENTNSVSSLTIKNYSGGSYEARAGYYVLCHGGIENPRTLLNANQQVKGGIGNENDLVGRFFMEHPHFNVASALLNHEHPAFTRYADAKQIDLLTAYYEPTRVFQETKKVLNFGLRFTPKKGIGTSPEASSFKTRLKRYVCESDTLLPLVDEAKGRIGCPYDLLIKTASEQAPNPASRIKLGKDTDRFGNLRVDVDWRMTELDKHTLKESALELGRIMAQNNLGRVRLSEWIVDPTLSFPDTSQEEVGGFHHMGTTRMAASPEQGVVNENLQVFNTSNLYIGGSSVFSTSGHVNPTFTIVQLSLRLADHLDNRINSS
jgi:choline dehydrogenase-like flavoprotein